MRDINQDTITNAALEHPLGTNNDKPAGCSQGTVSGPFEMEGDKAQARSVLKSDADGFFISERSFRIPLIILPMTQWANCCIPFGASRGGLPTFASRLRQRATKNMIADMSDKGDQHFDSDVVEAFANRRRGKGCRNLMEATRCTSNSW
jgi:hypothetical protein